MIKALISFVLMPMLTACTYSIILTDTHGVSSDVVDETDVPTAEVKPNINVTPY